MANKMFANLGFSFYGMVAILILTAYILFRLIIRLIKYHSDKESPSDNKRKQKAWTKEQVEKATDAGLIGNKPGWNEAQKRKAKELGLMNDREWTPDELELARQHNLLDEGSGWSHKQLQTAKQLNLI